MKFNQLGKWQSRSNVVKSKLLLDLNFVKLKKKNCKIINRAYPVTGGIFGENAHSTRR